MFFKDYSISGIKLGYKIEVSGSQTDLFTNNHIKYLVAITNKDSVIRCFDYQCPKYSEPDINDVLYCLINDYVYSKNCHNYGDFIKETGYAVDDERIKNTFCELRLLERKLEGLFTKGELNTLIEHFEDYRF